MTGIKLERLRETEYIVNFDTAMGQKAYIWAGAKKGKTMTREVPLEVFEYINLQTTTIRDGELRIANTTNKEEIEDQIPELDEYKANSHSRDEIVNLLKGNINKMKSELNKVTARSEKQFIKTIKDELMDSDEGFNSKKAQFVDEWFKELPAKDE